MKTYRGARSPVVRDAHARFVNKRAGGHVRRGNRERERERRERKGYSEQVENGRQRGGKQRKTGVAFLRAPSSRERGAHARH